MDPTLRPLHAHTLRSITDLVRCLTDEQLQAASDARLTIHQLRALQRIARTGRATVGEVAAHLDSLASTTTGIVDRLVRAGLVERRERPSNRRIHDLRLTADGEAVVGDASTWLADALAEGLEHEPRDDLEQIARAVDRLAGFATRVTAERPNLSVLPPVDLASS